MLSTTTCSRRNAMKAAAAAIAATASVVRGQTQSDETPWVDAHSHIWTPDIDRYPLQPGMTLDDLQPRSFTDEELMAVARPSGVGRVVLIQHNVFHGFDNSYLVDTCQKHPDLFRAVGTVDDLTPRPGLAMRQLLKKHVTGFRIRPRKGITNWLATDGMTEMWKTAVETRQPMCCLINPSDLPDVDRACQRHPDTPVVIDHFGRVGIDGVIRERDLKNLCRLARYPHVKVKISAYYALGAKKPPHHELIPMIRRLYETFGAHRLMWASDSPYQLQGENTYEASIALIRDTIDFVSDAERRQLLRDTAEQTFFFV